MDQRAGDGHALHLAAGELVGQARGLLFESHPAEPVARRFGGSWCARQQERQFHVFERGERGKQLEELEDETYACAAQGGEFGVGKRIGGAAVDPHLAGGGEVHGARQVQQGGLAATAPAHQRGDGAGRERERDVVQHLAGLASVAIGFGDSAEFQAGNGHRLF